MRSHRSKLAAYAVSRAVPAAASFLSVPLYTSLLQPTQFGTYAVLVAAVSIADALCFQWLIVSIVRFLPQFRNNPSSFVRTILRYYAWSLALVLGLSVVIVVVLPTQMRLLFGCALALLSVMAWNELNLELARSRFRVKDYAIAASLAAILGLLMGVWLTRLGLGEKSPIIGSTIGLTFTGLFFVFRIKQDLISATHSDAKLAFRSLIGYGGPMAAALVISSLLNASDRFLINHLLGSADVGVYAATWSLVFPAITILGSTINLAGFPEIIYGFETQDGSLMPKLRQQLTLLLKILVPAVVGAYLLGGDIAHAFLGSQFNEAGAALFPGLALVAAFSVFRSLYTDIAFHLSRRSDALSVIMVVALISSWSLNWALLPKFGVRAAVWSALTAYGLALTFSVAAGRKWFKLPLPTRLELIRLALSSTAMGLMLVLARGRSGRIHLLLTILLSVGVYFIADWLIGRLLGRRLRVSEEPS